MRNYYPLIFSWLGITCIVLLASCPDMFVLFKGLCVAGGAVGCFYAGRIW